MTYVDEMAASTFSLAARRLGATAASRCRSLDDVAMKEFLSSRDSLSGVDLLWARLERTAELSSSASSRAGCSGVIGGLTHDRRDI